nr:uncharacterized protein LOC102071130 [Zonotrichia albicollis]
MKNSCQRCEGTQVSFEPPLPEAARGKSGSSRARGERLQVPGPGQPEAARLPLPVPHGADRGPPTGGARPARPRPAPRGAEGARPPRGAGRVRGARPGAAAAPPAGQREPRPAGSGARQDRRAGGRGAGKEGAREGGSLAAAGASPGRALGPRRAPRGEGARVPSRSAAAPAIAGRLSPAPQPRPCRHLRAVPRPAAAVPRPVPKATALAQEKQPPGRRSCNEWKRSQRSRSSLPSSQSRRTSAVPLPHRSWAEAAPPRWGSALAAASGPRPAGLTLLRSRRDHAPREEEWDPGEGRPGRPQPEGGSRAEGRGGTGRGRPALPRTGPLRLTSPAPTPPAAGERPERGRAGAEPGCGGTAAMGGLACPGRYRSRRQRLWK